MRIVGILTAVVATAIAAPASAGSCDPDYLLVTDRIHVADWGRLLSHREQIGHRVQVGIIEQILDKWPGRDGAEKLRNYLQEFHARGGRFVFLAGDESNLPVRYTYQFDSARPIPIDNQELCDLYFADLTGDWNTDNDELWGEESQDHPDLTPELLVGRVPLTNGADIAAYIDRLILYETDPGRGDDSYLTSSILVTADQMRDTPAGGQHAAIARTFPSWFAIDTISAIEQPSGEDPNPSGPSGRDVEATLWRGWGIVQFLTHGRHDRFMVRTSGYNESPKSYLWTGPAESDHGMISRISDPNRPYFVYSLACQTAGFDTERPPFNFDTPHICEQLLGADGGAVGIVGYTRDGWVPVSYRLQALFFDSLFAHPDDPAVMAMYRAQAAYPWYRDLIYNQAFLGDPALRVYTRRPSDTALAANEPSAASLPDRVALYPNYPNPFNPSTTIRFDLPRRATVSLAVFNLLGQRVATLLSGEIAAGEHRIAWNTGDLASGTYLARLKTDSATFTQKLLLVK